MNILNKKHAWILNTNHTTLYAQFSWTQTLLSLSAAGLRGARPSLGSLQLRAIRGSRHDRPLLLEPRLHVALGPAGEGASRAPRVQHHGHHVPRVRSGAPAGWAPGTHRAVEGAAPRLVSGFSSRGPEQIRNLLGRFRPQSRAGRRPVPTSAATEAGSLGVPPTP